MINSVIGLMNSGKTLYMTRELWSLYLRGFNILANYDLNFPKIPGGGKVYKINKDYLTYLGKSGVTLKNTAIGLDELWIWMDSRRAIQNVIFTYFFNQSSKDDSQIFLTSQHNTQLDKRLRQNMHKVTSCSRVLLKKGQFEPINEEQRFLNDDQQNQLYIKAVEFKRVTMGFFSTVRPYSMKYIKAQPIFKLYDTTQKINTMMTEEEKNGYKHISTNGKPNDKFNAGVCAIP